MVNIVIPREFVEIVTKNVPLVLAKINVLNVPLNLIEFLQVNVFVKKDTLKLDLPNVHLVTKNVNHVLTMKSVMIVQVLELTLLIATVQPTIMKMA